MPGSLRPGDGRQRRREQGLTDGLTAAPKLMLQVVSRSVGGGGGGVSGGWRQPVACQSSPSGWGATDLRRLAAPGYRAMEEPVAPNVIIPDRDGQGGPQGSDCSHNKSGNQERRA